MRCTAFRASLLVIGLACSGHADASVDVSGLEQEEVALAAGGSIHRPSSKLVRKHSHHDAKEEDAEHHHHKQHHHQADAAASGHQHEHTKAMFHAIDVNKDGIVSHGDLEASAGSTHSAMPKNTLELLQEWDTNGDGGISFAEFAAAAKASARKNRMHGEQEPDDLAHESGSGALDPDPAPAPTPPATPTSGSDYVTCGGHKAATCEACTTTDASGKEVFDHGDEWCNGDCEWKEDACHAKGTINVNGVEAGYSNAAGKETPDLLNPEITKKDEEMIDEAAEDAVREEAKEKETKEEEEAEGTKPKKMPWMTIIMVMSGLLGVCTIMSCVAVITFLCMPKPEVPPTKEELLADEQDDGEEEGEAAEEDDI